MKTKITIVTVSFNCKNDIEPTILSVINQSYLEIEYIIIDGGSTDGTLEIINKYRDKVDILISEPDEGIFDAMNKGLKYASGVWVNFMNAGDTFYDLVTVDKVFENKAYHGIGVVYGSKITNGRTIHPEKLSSLKYGGIMACHQSIFYNREVCDEELYYKTKHKHYGDIELTRRLYLKGFTFIEVPITIANFKYGGFSSVVSTSARKAKFDYLYQNLGIKGICYGLLGKLKYLIYKF
ncbi:glycosyltransferase family 2 protein [Draconibacterium sp. IB214405]|uniref:glycosyltransferase family 2 protein n=1 Tax=Draconibacterium sp. IB214405 TaxID=3097352 RepID=UPI002A14CD77|nr:glycosyltransferase family 2 protein [Draconibacterium sp. IB214405]MDX8339295.1 glycosyltransferase family 2 protein [Draconibacterium sp. IB214405]